MTPLEMVRLDGLMARTTGSPKIMIGLIDGPVDTTHAGLAAALLRGHASGCAVPEATACTHATFVAGILSGSRNSPAPALCPGCTVYLRPIFADRTVARLPSATNDDLARALLECMAAGAAVVNVSAGPPVPSMADNRLLTQALDTAARRDVIVVAAAGNTTDLGTSTLTRHRWVVPVIAVDAHGRPARQSTLGPSIGRNGLAAPGGLTSFTAGNGLATLTGTSFAAPLVTGTIALLWSLFPRASAAEIRAAVLGRRRRGALIPPLLDAEAAYQQMKELIHAG
ncbi:S8 family serine peptidase [Nocardia sp. CS682]|uniref:S8 family serine peptidase n=1 Tax=Nocardia sp. CS682 TaxID=1047172 RepID=UPI0010753BDA|nr:S8 family serine peptidase [Nocardia sp. CS682]QBS43374.1 peptidase S8 [Nocardia sp. CS682]